MLTIVRGVGFPGLALGLAAAFLTVRATGQVPPASVHVEDHWPISKAVGLLEGYYGVPISLEDLSAYEYQGELRELDNFAQLQQARPSMKRILYPHGVLDVSFPEPATTATPASVANIVRALLAQHVKNGNAGQFRLLETSETLVILPTARKDSAGSLIPDRSPLELRISFPQADRDANTAFEVFCQAATKALGRNVGLWTNVGTWQQTVDVGANNEVARDVLVKILSGLHWADSAVPFPRSRISYAFAPLPGVDGYSFSVHQVSVERPDKYGRPTRVAVPRPGPLDMSRPALADIPSLRR